MIEQNTPYSDRLKKTECYWFSSLLEMCSEEFFLDAIKQGGRNLDTLSQMTSYMGYFGRFYEFLNTYPYDDLLPYEFIKNKEINIVDYGCGQAIWSMLYAHFLHLTAREQSINTVTLIEPSELLLKRAALHVSAFYPEAHVKTINKKLDDLTQNDIVCDSSIPTLHIMADVLESQDVDLERLARLVNDSLKGLNQFICVQLYFGNYKEDNRVRKFVSFFTKNARFGSVPQRDMELEYRDYPMLKGTTCAYAAFGDFDM